MYIFTCPTFPLNIRVDSEIPACKVLSCCFNLHLVRNNNKAFERPIVFLKEVTCVNMCHILYCNYPRVLLFSSQDLSCLNRDMSRIIMLDCSKDAISLQPRNSLVLKKWLGEDEDRTLVDLAHFLKSGCLLWPLSDLLP